MNFSVLDITEINITELSALENSTGTLILMNSKENIDSLSSTYY